MKHLTFPLLCTILCIILLGLCACGAPAEPTPEPTPPASAQPIRLWYVEGNAALDSLMAQLCKALPEEELDVIGFESELQLAQEADRVVPDLLICDYYRALDFDAAGQLTDLSSECSALCPARLTEEHSLIGRTFFPLAADAWLLYANTALYEQNMGCPLDAEGLSTIGRFCLAAAEYTEKTGMPFYTADCFAPFFAACFAQSGAVFTGSREADLQNKDYAPLYNLLAENAYSRALQIFSDANACRLTEEGQVICSFQPASALTETADGCTVLPLPQRSAGVPITCSRLLGFAVTCSAANASRCAKVLQVLYSGLPQAAQPFLAAGTIPFVGQEMPPSEDTLGTLLWQLRDCRFFILDSRSDYAEQFGRFDALFRSAMQQLNRS